MDRTGEPGLVRLAWSKPGLMVNRLSALGEARVRSACFFSAFAIFHRGAANYALLAFFVFRGNKRPGCQFSDLAGDRDAQGKAWEWGFWSGALISR
jgi:hypothetical protein